MPPPSCPGVYIVTLNNTVPISVNADRPKIAERCIKVTRENCKVGEAVDLSRRKRDYAKTFSEKNVNFFVLSTFETSSEAKFVEKQILDKLANYRMRGVTGRLNEWLEGISAEDAREAAENVIRDVAGSEAAPA